MIEIRGRKIGLGEAPYFVAEIGSNHDGSLDRAVQLIALASIAGADAVKFQYFRPETLVSYSELPEVYVALEGLAVPSEWTPRLRTCCHENGVAFLATPFDLEAVDHLGPLVDGLKIASGDLTYADLIGRSARTGKPVFLATGASTEDEVDRAVGTYLEAAGEEEYGQNLVLMQCTANYDGTMEGLRHVNLRVIPRWSDLLYCTLGLSDHTLGHAATCAAVALGASVIEKHFTDDRTRNGPDHPFAMTPMAWRRMVEAAREVYECLGDGVKRVEANEDPVIMRRALRWGADLSRGHLVSSEDVAVTRPCPDGALTPHQLGEVAGRRLIGDVSRDSLVRLTDLGTE